ncbi:DUF5711 family protein [Marvinbryantia formatexigens]|nr:DUF5711 family protein [Marvinbryantia formatexigens]
MQSDEMMSLSEKLRLHRDKVHLRTVLLAAVVLLVVGGAFVYSRVRVFRHYRVLSSVERSDDTATSYVRIGSRTLKCNPNGVTCVNDSGDVQWNVTFTLQSPVVDVCDTTVAVGDQGGQDVYVFDENGQMGHFEVEYTLTKVRVAKQGVVAAVLEDGASTYINVYDVEGNLLVKSKTSMNETGYPLDVDISQDGQKMMVSYLAVDNSDVKTDVVFYNFSSVGQSQTDYQVNSVELGGIVVPEVHFLGGSYAVAFRDDGLVFFRGRQVPEQGAEITVEQEIISVFHTDDYVGMITASDDETHKYKMQVYRADGSRCGTGYFDMDYANVIAADGEIILYGTDEMEIYSTGGRKKASLEYEKQIYGIIKTGGFRKYQVITPDSTDTIRLR